MEQLSCFDAGTISVVPPRQLHFRWWCVLAIGAAVAGGIVSGGAGTAIIGGAGLIYAACHQ